MVAYATTADIEDRWRPLTTAETVRASTLLEAASRLIRASVPLLDTRVLAAEVDSATVTDIACDMVIRVLASGVAGAGVQSRQVTVGAVTTSTSYSASMSGSSGSLYLKPGELYRLSPVLRGAFSISISRPDASS